MTNCFRCIRHPTLMEVSLAVYNGNDRLFDNWSGWLSILGNGRDQVVLIFVVSGGLLLIRFFKLDTASEV